jgi:ABC-type branched-subunit amino acid transport system ATPase component
MPALALQEVVLDYGAVRAVDHVTFDVDGGEVCGLVGPNGSGKSSLLNTISGLVRISNGTISVGGRVVSSERPHVVARQGVGRTFQHVRLLHGLTVEDNIAAGYFTAVARSGMLHTLSAVLLPRKISGKEREHVEDALERAGLADVAHLLVDELSFAMQRRVEIARSIVSRPKLLLFDEPAAGLGVTDLEVLAGIIRSEAERGCGVILVDHHLHFVLELCPRLVVLNFGNKIFDGPGDAAIEDPAVREAYVGG